MTEFQRRQITVSRSNSDCTAKRMAGSSTNHFIRQYVDRNSFRRKSVSVYRNKLILIVMFFLLILIFKYSKYFHFSTTATCIVAATAILDSRLLSPRSTITSSRQWLSWWQQNVFGYWTGTRGIESQTGKDEFYLYIYIWSRFNNACMDQCFYWRASSK